MLTVEHNQTQRYSTAWVSLDSVMDSSELSNLDNSEKPAISGAFLTFAYPGSVRVRYSPLTLYVFCQVYLTPFKYDFNGSARIRKWRRQNNI